MIIILLYDIREDENICLDVKYSHQQKSIIGFEEMYTQMEIVQCAIMQFRRFRIAPEDLLRRAHDCTRTVMFPQRSII